MAKIRVCSLAALSKQQETPANCLVSVIDQGIDAQAIRPAWIHPKRHFIFHFSDIDLPGPPPSPQPDQVRDIVALGRRLVSEPDASILIHCVAGISRSPAVAMVFFCIQMGEGNELQALHHALQCCDTDWVWPNGLIVRYADDDMQRKGRMVRALDGWKALQMGGD